MIRLITIPFSHYCDKARWALDRAGVTYEEDGHLPLFHYVPVRRAGGKRTVPVLVVDDATLVCDSTEIIAWADAQNPGMALPIDRRDRETALALEDEFDRGLGPAARRWAYYHLLPRKDFARWLVHGVPRWELTALTVARPLAIALMRRGLSINAASVERSRVKIEETFAKVNALLRDGRRFLVGDTFSVADLTFAALATPAILPHDHPIPMPTADDLPVAARDQVNAWRDTAAGRHVLTMYQSERRTKMGPGPIS